MAGETTSGKGAPENNPQGADPNQAKQKFTRSGLKVHKRMIEAYIVPKSDLHTLSIVNAIAAICLSLAASCFGGALAVFFEVRVQGEKNLDQVGLFIKDYVPPAGIILGILFTLIAVVSILTRKNIIEHVTIESE